jgi:hypothetical protein
MKTIRLTCHNRKTDALLAHLTGKVFHLTTFSAFTAIRKSRMILHNKECRFKLNTTSDISFGRLMGYVCFFDLRNHSAEVSEHIIHNYNFLGPTWFENARKGWLVSRLAYLILNPIHYENLIHSSAQNDYYKTTGKYLHFIPHGEIWIDDHVSLDWIDTVILADMRRPLVKGSLEWMCREIEKRRKPKK